ncbi:MAG: DNA polymerase III subunit gamma/tau [Oscillospiraceae bacterium]
MYLALYRKYRPKTFEDVIGQPHITITLKNEVMNNRTAHAYLFTGPRGTGKTTCSKVLAMAVNCESSVDGNPCLICDSCKAIESGSTLDVVEIDAASNNGVDNIRGLRDEASYTPAQCKYRVYIIDETHMLSAGAFNALLKIMEEPPEHVKFILATTEAHKVPATIVSRCQRFDFRRIKATDIKEALLLISQNESFTLDGDAADLIARLADGGMRDALSILDQCVAFSHHVDINTVSSAAGVVGREYLFELTDCVIANDASKAVSIIDTLYSMSKDLQGLLEEMVNHFRNVMLMITLKKPDDLIIALPDEFEKIKTYTTKLPLATILYAISQLQECLDKMSKSFDKRLTLELCFIKLCTPSMNTQNDGIIARLEKLENMIKNGKFASVQSPTPQPVGATVGRPSDTPQTPVQTSNDFVPLAEWADILFELTKVNMPLCGVLNGSKAFTKGGFVYIGTPSGMAGKLMKQEGNASQLISIIENKTGLHYKIKIKSTAPKAEEQGNKLDEVLNKAKENGVKINEN